MSRSRSRSLIAALTVLIVTSTFVALQPATASAAPSAKDGCTITGTSGDDVLRGTPGDDVICGLGGNDILVGGGGNDELRGGPGNDQLHGGPGSDLLIGGRGQDLSPATDMKYRFMLDFPQAHTTYITLGRNVLSSCGQKAIPRFMASGMGTSHVITPTLFETGYAGCPTDSFDAAFEMSHHTAFNRDGRVYLRLTRSPDDPDGLRVKCIGNLDCAPPVIEVHGHTTTIALTLTFK